MGAEGTEGVVEAMSWLDLTGVGLDGSEEAGTKKDSAALRGAADASRTGTGGLDGICQSLARERIKGRGGGGR